MNEIQISYPTPSLANLYVVLTKLGTNQSVKVADGTLITDNNTNVAATAIAISDTARPTHYIANLPANTPDGTYKFDLYQGATHDTTLDTLLGTSDQPLEINRGAPISVRDISWDALTQETSPPAGSAAEMLAASLGLYIFASVNDGAPVATSFIGSGGLSTVTGMYTGSRLKWLPGARNYGQPSQLITNYSNSRKLTLTPACIVAAPNNGDKFVIVG